MCRVTETGGRVWIDTANEADPTGTSASSNGNSASSAAESVSRRCTSVVRRAGVLAEGAGEAGHRLENPAHVSADLVQHVEPIALIAGLVAQLLQTALEDALLVRHGDHGRAGVVAHSEVLRVRRQ